MKKPVTSEIRAAANLVVNEAKRALDDRKTSWFIIVMVVNVFLWGLFLSEWRQVTTEVDDLNAKQDTTMVYIHSLEKKILKLEQTK